MESKITAVLGASAKPERYSNKALRMLKQYGHQVIPVHPAQAEIEGIATARSLTELPHGIDTITVYVSPETSEKMVADFIAKAPRRVILNPGAESPLLEAALHQAGVQVERACTLVLLQTGPY
jgi:predicted CoA-binding protein